MIDYRKYVNMESDFFKDCSSEQIASKLHRVALDRIHIQYFLEELEKMLVKYLKPNE